VVGDRFNGSTLGGMYYDALAEQDWSLGRILQRLKKHNLDTNTMVVYSSDNGPSMSQCKSGEPFSYKSCGNAGALACAKGTTWEGGMREPGIVWWPSVVPAGERRNQVASLMDLFTTSLELANVSLPMDRVIDGKSLMPILLNSSAPSQHEALFYWRGNTLMAVRSGPYKAHFYTKGCQSYDNPPLTKHNPPKLYNLEQDPGESWPINLSTLDPAILQNLMDLARNHTTTMVPGKPLFDDCNNAYRETAPDFPPFPDKPYTCQFK
jgi:arylsulfatase